MAPQNNEKIADLANSRNVLTIWRLGYFLRFLTCEEEKAKDHDRRVAKVEEC